MRESFVAVAAALSLLATFIPGVVRAGETVMVDDDGHAYGGNCAAHDAAFRRIQPAVNASGPGDTILVCPGTYTGHVVIGEGKDGLTLSAATRKRPVIRAPRHRVTDEYPGPKGVIHVHDAYDVTIRGFRFQPHGGAGKCDRGPLVTLFPAGGAHLVGNRFVAVRPYGSLCGGYHSALQVFAWGGAHADIEFVGNVVQDFNNVGADIFIADGGIGSALVSRNRFVIRHRTKPDPVSLFGGSQGAMVIYADGAVVSRNYITSAPHRRPTDAIEITGTAPTIERNVVSRARNGIYVNTFNGTVRENVILGAAEVDDGIGIFARAAQGVVIADNLATGFSGHGIKVTDARVSIRDNDFRGNRGIDCVDTTHGTGTAGTRNTWTGNLGFDSSPHGLCQRN